MKKMYPTTINACSFNFEQTLRKVFTFLLLTVFSSSVFSQDMAFTYLSLKSNALVAEREYQKNLQLPIKLLSFTANSEETKILLNWSASQQYNTSHFTVQRSLDGSEFFDMCTVNKKDSSQELGYYDFTDNVNLSTFGALYYRLRIVDADGRIQESDVRMIRIGEENESVSMLAYFNPGMKELFITVPPKWQDQQVIYDVYNTVGQHMKHVVNDNAGQTQIIGVADVAQGEYIIKVSCGWDTSIQRIIKAK